MDLCYDKKRSDDSVKYDYLVVGAGLFGAVFARQCRDAGKTVLVIDKRPHIAIFSTPTTSWYGIM